jgi:hypothetical protein
MSADFEPERKVVTAITNAAQAVITAAAHGYATSDVVRINVPVNYGMRFPTDEVIITVVNANSFSVNTDTSLLDTFVAPGGTVTSAEVLPISGMTDNVAT